MECLPQKEGQSGDLAPRSTEPDTDKDSADPGLPLLQNSLKHLPHHSSPGVKDRVAFYSQGPTLLYFFIFQHLLNSSPSSR